MAAESVCAFVEVIEGPAKGTTYRCEVRTYIDSDYACICGIAHVWIVSANTV